MTTLPFPNLRLTAYRGLRGVELVDLQPVNILVGGNNSGKTSVLEALLLLASPVDPGQWEMAVGLRGAWPLADLRFRASGYDRLQALSWLFPRSGADSLPIEISGGGAVQGLTATVESLVGQPPAEPIVGPDEIVEGAVRGLNRYKEPEAAGEDVAGLMIKLGLVPHASTLFGNEHVYFRFVLWERGRSFRLRSRVHGPTVPVAFATPISHRSDGYLANRVSKLLRTKRKARAIELLTRLDARVTDLTLLTPEREGDDGAAPVSGGSASLHVEYSDVGLVPVHAMGDGLRRALHFAALLADLEPGSVLLIDEVEVGMHTSVLRDVFAWLCEACRVAEVQLFVTTHSLEAVDAMLQGTPNDEIALYRITPRQARRYSGEALRRARVELGHEVR